MKGFKIKPILGIILTFLITGIVTSVLVYLYREQEIQNLNSELTLLKTNTAQEASTEKEDIDVNEVGDEDPYAVIFIPGGLFTDTERDLLREKLVKPYFDYYNDEEHAPDTEVISMVVEKDEDETYYKVDIVVKTTYDGTSYGHRGFLFGSTENPFDYWVPECIDTECEFSNSYHNLHPEVVDQYESCPECGLDVDI
jgi:hypothetical protein